MSTRATQSASQNRVAETPLAPHPEVAQQNPPSGAADLGTTGAGTAQATGPSTDFPGAAPSGPGIPGSDGTAIPPIGPLGDPAAATVASVHQAGSAGIQVAPSATEAALPQWLEPVTDWAPQLESALRDLAGLPTVADLIETVGNGGPVLIVLALLSVAAMTIVLVKMWQLTRLRIGARQPVDRALALWYRLQDEQAIGALAGRRQPSARLVHRAMVGLQAPGADETLLREELTRFGIQLQEQLCRGLRALEVIATLSPLLGLLGTVLGMIEAFRQLEQAGSQVDPSILSGGIWQALLTTAAGLSIAIPVVMLHAWLERKVDAHGHRMDDAVTRVFTRDLSTPLPILAKGPEPAPTVAAEALVDAT